MKYLVNIIRLILIVFISAYASTTGLIVLLFTFSSDKCINTAVGLFSRSLFFVSRVKLESYGNLNIEKSPGKIYVSNHESHYDPPALSLACPHPLYFIAKKELKYVPFIGWYIWLSGMIFIDRKNKNKAAESIRNAGLSVKKGKNVISFPEGTRSKPGELLTFRRGSFRMAKEHGLEIVPVGILGSGKILASGSMFINPGIIKVNVGQVISPEVFENMTVEELASFLRSKVAALIEELEMKA